MQNCTIWFSIFRGSPIFSDAAHHLAFVYILDIDRLQNGLLTADRYQPSILPCYYNSVTILCGESKHFFFIFFYSSAILTNLYFIWRYNRDCYFISFSFVCGNRRTNSLYYIPAIHSATAWIYISDNDLFWCFVISSCRTSH